MQFVTVSSNEASVDDGDRAVTAHLYSGQRVLVSHYQPDTGRYFAIVESAADGQWAGWLAARLATGLFAAAVFDTAENAARHIDGTFGLDLSPLLVGEPPLGHLIYIVPKAEDIPEQGPYDHGDIAVRLEWFCTESGGEIRTDRVAVSDITDDDIANLRFVHDFLDESSGEWGEHKYADTIQKILTLTGGAR